MSRHLPCLAAVVVTLGAFAVPAADAALVLQYNFDEGTGTTAADTSGFGTPAPGTLVNGAGWTTNTPASSSPAALNTPNATPANFVTAADNAKLDGLSAFTLTTWINLQSAPTGNRRLLSKQQAGDFDGFSWNFADSSNTNAENPRSASNFGMRLFVGGTTGFAFDPTVTTMVVDANNKWTFLAVTYDGTATTNNVNYYAGSESGDVTLLATTTVNAGTTASDADNAALFGVGYTDAAPASNTSIPGFVDDARVYNTALSPTEINAVRLANVPEPAAVSLLAVPATLLATRRRRT